MIIKSIFTVTNRCYRYSEYGEYREIVIVIAIIITIISILIMISACYINNYYVVVKLPIVLDVIVITVPLLKIFRI